MFEYLRHMVSKAKNMLSKAGNILVNIKLTKGIVNVVSGVISIVLVIVVGLIVLGQLTTTFSSMGLSEQAQNIINNLMNQVWNAFNLFIIVPILVVAGVIILILRGFGGGQR